MVSEVHSDSALDTFAESIGAWLLEQRFGAIRPLAFSWRRFEVSEGSDDGDFVVIELTVEDPPAPPENWRSLPIEEASKLLIWPEEDMQAAEAATREYARGLAVPPGINPLWPANVVFHAHSRQLNDAAIRIPGSGMRAIAHTDETGKAASAFPAEFMEDLDDLLAAEAAEADIAAHGTIPWEDVRAPREA